MATENPINIDGDVVTYLTQIMENISNKETLYKVYVREEIIDGEYEYIKIEFRRKRNEDI